VPVTENVPVIVVRYEAASNVPDAKVKSPDTVRALPNTIVPANTDAPEPVVKLVIVPAKSESTVEVPEPELLSNTTLSEEPGTPAPLAPPEDVAQLVLLDQLPLPPVTQ